ncbi:pyridoxamine 5'-phosphate oxidase [Alteraurantiacibacter aquimixticola]|uniref:Pyridoxine/pyridoxamine 5'-phosphate oxidase n=1 Tax=Alteraurantiacibacter aquimixticola TaxID=2489173 RepID=A0A4T3EX93_9SPHN|nr:pyridoxamine 5'-phosphate oxidase [Alteraurantiacibacter aquimixticola]TIX49196.1 pyridoxamine 5'-phosphate oxidase [Alteraurantiacibacter aquimixticola]
MCSIPRGKQGSSTVNDAENAIPEIDPFTLFEAWFAEAQSSEPNDPNAMALATATPEGAPSVRMVLLKGHDERGFVFYTNAGSRKGREVLANPQAALLFHWKSLRRQIRIEGPLAEVTAEEADAYFHSRPRKSQIGSAASDQSRPLPDRETYLARVGTMAGQYEGHVIPRPPHWTGFRLDPARMEFWQDRPNRLHERRQFDRAADGGWTSSLLYP